MRLVWFLPLTYVAGIDGFGWFIPYLILVGTLAATLSYVKHRRRVRPALTLRIPRDLLEFEAAPA